MMPEDFKEANVTLLKPESMTDKECSSLRVYTDGKQCVSCWGLSLIERLKVLFYGKIWLGVLSGHTQPPVWMDCGKTVFIKEGK